MATLKAVFAADSGLGGQDPRGSLRLGERSDGGVSSSTRGRRELIGGREPAGEGQAPQRLGTGALMGRILSQAELLAKKEIELAKTELRADLRSEVRLAQGLGVAAVAALVTVNLLLVTVALALSRVIPGWAAGLTVAGVMLIVALLFATVSWHSRLRDPMAHTRRTLKDGVKWTRERFA